MYAIVDWYVIKIISVIESSKNGTYSIKTQHPSCKKKKKKKTFLKKSCKNMLNYKTIRFVLFKFYLSLLLF